MRTSHCFLAFVATVIATTGNATCSREQPLDFIGSPAPARATVDEVIVITGTTKYVNVTGGSTVKFVVGDRSFIWSFENGGAHTLPFDLARIAPKGLLNHPVETYVSDDPLYLG